MNKVYLLTVLEIGSYGEGDYTIGIYSSELNAIEAYNKKILEEDNPEEYCMHITEYKLDE